MILMRANPLLRPLEGLGPENLNFWTQMALTLPVAISGSKKAFNKVIKLSKKLVFPR
jgi:hypothetical protein